MDFDRYSWLIWFSSVIVRFGLVIPASGAGDVSDFPISTEPTPSLFVQKEPRLYPISDGGFIVAWEDHRLGELSYFAQWFDSSGAPIGDNFLIVGNHPIAFTPNGTGMVVRAASVEALWPELYSYEIYGQFLPASGEVGDPFFIDSRILPWCATGFWGLGVRLTAARDCFILGLNFGGGLTLKKFSLDGRLIFDSENSLLLPVDVADFSLAVNEYNQYVLLWFNANPDILSSGIYATFLSSTDTIIADSVLVQAYTPEYRYQEEAPHLRVVAVSDTAFRFFWADADSLTVKYVTYSPSGQTLSPVGRIDLLPPSWGDTWRSIDNFSFTNIRYGGFGLLVSLRHRRIGYDLDFENYYTNLLSWFDLNGLPLGVPATDSLMFPVVGDNLVRLFPDVLACPVEISNDIFLCALQNFTWLDSSRANDDTQGANQLRPLVVPTDEQTFFVTWQDEKGYRGRSVDLEGHFLSDEVILDGEEIHFFPSGTAVNFWEKQFDPVGAVAGLTIYNTHTWLPTFTKTLAHSDWQFRAQVTGLPISDSSFVVLVVDNDQLTLVSYFLSGQKAEEVVVASDGYFHWLHLLPNNGNSFWASWNGQVQLYSDDLQPLSSTFDLELSSPMLYVGQGHFLKSVRHDEGTYMGIYAVIVDTNGIEVERFRLVNDIHATNLGLTQLDSTKFVVLWTLDKEVYARTFTVDGRPVTDLLPIHAHVVASRDWANVCVNDGKVLFVWSDTRNWGHGYDVYGSIHPLGEISGVLAHENSQSFPSEPILAQNYPNPFNPTTTIEFSVPQSGIVTLNVYDLLGREVETILNEYRDAGHHKTQWNASNAPSGIYFVKMQAGDFSQTRKVMLLE